MELKIKIRIKKNGDLIVTIMDIGGCGVPEALNLQRSVVEPASIQPQPYLQGTPNEQRSVCNNIAKCKHAVLQIHCIIDRTPAGTATILAKC
jgi:hypothetical protein